MPSKPLDLKPSASVPPLVLLAAGGLLLLGLGGLALLLLTSSGAPLPPERVERDRPSLVVSATASARSSAPPVTPWSAPPVAPRPVASASALPASSRSASQAPASSRAESSAVARSSSAAVSSSGDASRSAASSSALARSSRAASSEPEDPPSSPTSGSTSSPASSATASSSAPPVDPVGKTIAFYRRNLVGKNIVFVFDQSASISNLQLKLRRELRGALKQMNPSYRFNLIAFHGSARFFAPQLVSANTYNVNRAWEWIRDLHTKGATVMAQAFKAAVHFEGVQTVVLMTDGKLDGEDFTLLRDYLKRRVGSTRAAQETPMIELIPMIDEFKRADKRIKYLVSLAEQQPEIVARRLAARRAAELKKGPTKAETSEVEID